MLGEKVAIRKKKAQPEADTSRGFQSDHDSESCEWGRAGREGNQYNSQEAQGRLATKVV